MRIVRLDVAAFGPFTNKSLAFENGPASEAPKLHVVYGPNEAGKSSSLRALSQWLYGIPHASTDNFVHPHTEMRIGGVVANRSGEKLEFIRRKGRTATLRAADDIAPLDPAILEKHLAGIDAATFQQKFGISHEELRRGGAALVAGGGEVGESLFAAASGIAGLHTIQKGLDDEAAALFKPTGSKPTINKTIKLHKAACDLIKKSSLNSADFDERTGAYGKMELRLAELDTQLREARKERRRLERIEKSLPHIARHRDLKKDHREVASAPLLPVDFSRMRGVTAAELESAERAASEAERAIDALKTDLAGLRIEPELLSNRSTIEALYKELGSHDKAGEDRRKLVAQAEECERQVQRLLVDLGRDAKSDRDGWRLPKAARQRLQAIGAARQARVERCEATGAALRRLREKISQLATDLADSPEAKDVGELERALNRARQEGPLDQQFLEVRRRLNRLEKQAEIEFSRLGHFAGPSEALESLPIPAAETIDRFEAALGSVEKLVERLEAAAQTANEELAKTIEAIEGLHSQGEVPSEEQLREARASRDLAWRAIERRWLNGDSAVPENATKSNVELAAAYRESVVAADEHADRLRREAGRVEKAASLAAQHRDQTHRCDKVGAEKEAAQAAIAATWRDWRAVWAPISIEPLPPREMRSWVARHKECAALAAQIRQTRQEIDELAARIEKRCRAVSTAAVLDGSPNLKRESLADVIEAADALLAKQKSLNQKRATIEAALAERRSELPPLEAEEAAAARAFQAWQDEWKESVAALNLEANASFAEANAVIDKIAELEKEFDQARELRSRIRGIEDDAENFAGRVSNLLSRVAPDLGGLPANESAGAVYDRLQAALNAETHRAAWDNQLRVETAKRNDAEATIRQKSEAIAAMCRLAGCASPDELPQGEERSNRRREIERDLRAEEDALREQAAGTPLEGWIEECVQQDPDAIHGQLRQQDDVIQRTEEEKTAVATTMGALGKELELMDGSSAAADARHEAELLLSQIRSDAEEFIRLKLASIVLRKSIERFREASQGSTLRRASDLFSKLTIGSFAGLRADYDDRGQAVLVGVRPDGKTVGVAGMSDGSCDQLYLALRLALLESYLDNHEPMPFIVDDILIMFDDPRAAAALEALADLAKKTQVIFFTHHEHLVRLAREHLPPESISVHSLV